MSPAPGVEFKASGRHSHSHVSKGLPCGKARGFGAQVLLLHRDHLPHTHSSALASVVTSFSVSLIPAALTNTDSDSVSVQEVAVFCKWSEGNSRELKAKLCCPKEMSLSVLFEVDSDSLESEDAAHWQERSGHHDNIQN